MPALPPDRPGCPKAPGGRRPLPDAAAIRLYLVPDPAPPYDVEAPAGEPGGRGLPAWERGGRDRAGERGRRTEPAHLETAHLETAHLETAHLETAHLEPAHLEPAHLEASQLEASQLEAQRRTEPGHGEPGHREPGQAAPPPGWQSRFAQVLAETLAGSRPPRQLVPWTTQQALDRIQRLGPRLASGQRPRVRRVLTSRPAADVLEMTVVVGFGPRVNALAVRLERSWPGPQARPGEPSAARWVCTAVEAA